MVIIKRVARSLIVSIATIAFALVVTPKIKAHKNSHEGSVTFLHNSYAQVTSSKGLAVVDFFADWCGACKAMTPVYHEVAHEMKKSANREVRNIKFYAANVDEFKQVSDDLHIQGIPSFAFYRDGKLIGVQAGFMTKEHFITLVKSKFGLH